MDQRQLTECEAHRVGEVLQSHHRLIEAVAARYAPSRDHVPDIIQEVGIKVCLGLGNFRGESQIRTWLYRITMNESINYWRREQRQARAVEAISKFPMDEPVIDPDEAVQRRERVAALREAIQRLRPKQREAMRNQLQIPIVLSGSKATSNRARRTLRKLLTDDPRLAQ
jgi:RNA polymerase sigma-70 factor (ECF subfamily)